MILLFTLQATSGPELEKTNCMIDNNNFKKNLSNGNIPETLNERILVASEGNYCFNNLIEIALHEMFYN